MTRFLKIPAFWATLSPTLLFVSLLLFAFKFAGVIPSRVWLLFLLFTAVVSACIGVLGIKELNCDFGKLASQNSALEKEKASLKELSSSLFSLKHRCEEEAIASIKAYEKEMEAFNGTKELSQSLKTSLDEAMDLLRKERQAHYLQKEQEEEEALFSLDWFRAEVTAFCNGERDGAGMQLERMVGYLLAATEHIERLEDEVETLEALVSKAQSKKKASPKKAEAQEVLELKF
jgi:hypothetical protein